jgi:hypothetical protein
MQEACDPPACGLMTVSAFAAEQFTVRFAIAVTGCAIEAGLFRFFGDRQSQKALHVINHLTCHARMALLACRAVRAYSKKGGMIHFGRTNCAGMLCMAAAAILNGRMKGGRLLAEIDSGGRVACNASGCLDTPRRRVARLALSGQERMFLGQGAGQEGIPPTRNRRRSRLVKRDDGHHAAGDSHCDQRRVKKSELLHGSHRSP